MSKSFTKKSGDTLFKKMYREISLTNYIVFSELNKGNIQLSVAE